MDIGFIGLGEMGAAMVRKHAESRATRFGSGTVRRNAPRRWPRTAREVVGSPAEAFTGDAVFSMLADDAALREVIDARCWNTRRAG